MIKILIHAGFHKTGTSTVQYALKDNKPVLSQHMQIYLGQDFPQLIEACHAFSVHPNSDGLELITDTAHAFFASLDPDDTRPIIMSCEGLSGIIPGRRSDINSYSAVPFITCALANAASAHLDRAETGRAEDVAFYFSTRDKQAWVHSCWWQNVRHGRMRMDLDAFHDWIRGAKDMGAVLQETATAVAPCGVISETLEVGSSMPQGPLTPILNLFNVPEMTRASLQLPERVNERPGPTLEKLLLELNRSELDNKALQNAKNEMRRSWRKRDAAMMAKDDTND